MARGDDRGHAVVTGASGGIGEKLARIFAREGHDVVLVARSAQKLEALAGEIRGAHGVAATVVALDLGDAEAPAELAERLDQAGIRVRHLVNNAGFGLSGPFSEHALEDELGLIDLNIRALSELTHRFLPQIREGRGGILNVASIAAFMPGPFMATYYASKAYVLSFSEALAIELKGSGVTVTALCPGPTPTGFGARAGMKDSALFRMAPKLTAEAVAEKGYAAYRRGRAVCIPGASAGLAGRLSAMSPHAMTGRVAALLNRSRG